MDLTPTDLGIHEATLGNRVNLAKKNGTVLEKPVTADDRARLWELEDEVPKLRMERDFLKKDFLKKVSMGALRARTGAQ